MTFAIPDLPLYWRLKDPGESTPAGIPATYPFVFDEDASLGLLTQRVGPELEAIQAKIYQLDSNVGYLQIGGGLAEGYGGDLLRFLDECFERIGTPASALEIGCGGCYVLKALHDRGIDLQGVDPSPVASRLASEHGLNVLTGFFPNVAVRVPVDFIYHSDVLEHITDPVGFLRGQRSALAPNGHIAIAVPDCTQAIAAGDLSMIIHQHVNYFDADSLRRTVEAAGYSVLALRPSGFGGSLYCLAGAGPGKTARPAASGQLQAFSQRAERAALRVTRLLREGLARHGSGNIGCYVPLRAIPYLAAAGLEDGVRLFDDAPEMLGRCIDGCEIPYESFVDLKRRPVAEMLIFSFSFAEKIRAKLRLEFGASMVVHTISEVVE